MSILKVEKVQKAQSCQFQHIFRDQEEYCNIPFQCQYFVKDTKNSKLKTLFEHYNLSFTKSLQNSNTSVI